jgi:hypothetical protein
VKLFDLYVQLSVTGQAAVQAATAQVEAGLQAAGVAGAAAGASIQSALGAARGAAQAAGSGIAAAGVTAAAGLGKAAAGARQLGAAVQTYGVQAAQGLSKAAASAQYLGAAVQQAAATAGRAGVTALQQTAAAAAPLGAGLSALTGRFAGLLGGVQAVGRVAGVAFATATGAVLGWVAAGLRGTGVGELLSLRFGMLSREIAAVFLPTINRISDGIAALTAWFYRLTGTQQDQLQKWALTAAAALGVAAVLPKVAGALQAVAAGFKVVSAVAGGGIFGGVLAAVLALGAGGIVAQGGIGALAEAFAPLVEIAKDFAVVLATLVVPVMNALGSVFQAVSGWIAEHKSLVEALVLVFGGAYAAVKAYAAVMWVLNTAKAAYAAVMVVVNALEGNWLKLAAAAVALAGGVYLIKKAFDSLRESGRLELPGLKKAPGEEEGEGHRTVSKTPVAFEGLDGLWRRAQIAALGGDKQDTAKLQLVEQEKTNDKLDAISERLGRIKPAVAGGFGA